MHDFNGGKDGFPNIQSCVLSHVSPSFAVLVLRLKICVDTKIRQKILTLTRILCDSFQFKMSSLKGWDCLRDLSALTLQL